MLCAAMDVLVQHGGPHGEVTVTTFLLENANPAVRAAAAFGLGSRGAVCVRPLAVGLKDSSETVRIAAAKSLAACAPHAVRSVLDTRPKEQMVQVRNALRDFLITHGGSQQLGTQATSALRELLGTLS
jgi:HEAT repeat protein